MTFSDLLWPALTCSELKVSKFLRLLDPHKTGEVELTSRNPTTGEVRSHDLEPPSLLLRL